MQEESERKFEKDNNKKQNREALKASLFCFKCICIKSCLKTVCKETEKKSSRTVNLSLAEKSRI